MGGRCLTLQQWVLRPRVSPDPRHAAAAPVWTAAGICLPAILRLVASPCGAVVPDASPWLVVRYRAFLAHYRIWRARLIPLYRGAIYPVLGPLGGAGDQAQGGAAHGRIGKRRVIVHQHRRTMIRKVVRPYYP